MIEGASINVNGLMDGDERAFQGLFVDYYSVLVSFAMKYLDNQEAAEDIVQDVFVKIWETREKLGGIDNLSAYLYQMVRFRSFNYLRAEKIRQDATRSFAEELEESEINEYIKNETFRIVMRTLEDLPPGSRNVFSRAIQGYSAKEIADELGIAVETVKKQKQVARRILKEKLGNLFSLFFLWGELRVGIPFLCSFLKLVY